MPVRSFKHHDLIGPGAASHPVWILLTRPLDEDLHALTYMPGIFFRGDLINEGEQPLIAFFLDLRRHLTGHRRRRRVLAGRVTEDKRLMKTRLATKRQRGFEVFLRLARKADD